MAAGKVLAREISQILRNSQLLFFCFVLPICWLLIVWGLLGQGVMQKVPVALVDQDNSPQSRERIQALSACRAIQFLPFLSPAQALDSMSSGKTYGVMLFPADFGRQELLGNGGTAVLWVDENRYAVAGVLRAELAKAMQAVKMENLKFKTMKTGAAPAQARRMISVVEDDIYALGNMETSFLAFLGSTLLPSLIMIGAMFTFVTAFLRELWHKSVNRWLAAADYRLIPAVIGKLLPYFCVYILIFLFYIALFSGQGGFNATGALAAWICLGIACLTAFAAAAILVAAIAPTWRMALVISAGYAAPALPFTGFSMPLDSMGEAAAIFSRCLPLTWYIQGQAQTWTLGARFGDLTTAFGGLFCIIAATLALGLPLLAWSYGKHAAREAKA